jgi:hypothetical protein
MNINQLIDTIANRDHLIAVKEAQLKRLCCELPNIREYTTQSDSQRETLKRYTNRIADRIDAIRVELDQLNKL